jgi:hypothetical protein
MELPLVKLVEILVAYVRDWQTTLKKQGRTKLRNTIEEVTSTVMKMVSGFDAATPAQRKLWQAELRAMYEKVSSLVPVPTQGRYNMRADFLVNMIAAGRIYYWLRTFDGQRTLDGMTAEQLTEGLKRPDITRSNAATVKEVLAAVLKGERVGSGAIALATDRCLQVIAEAKVHLLEYVLD